MKIRLFAAALLLAAALPASAQYGMGTPAQPSYQGLWWNAPAGSESGWGLNITHQGSVLFATWFTYDTDGTGMWLVMPNGMLQANMAPMDPYGYGYGDGYPMDGSNTFTYTGTLYRTTGPAFNGTFNPASVNATTVGAAVITFSDPDNGTFSYTVNGVTQMKSITRQVFAAMPACSFTAMTSGTLNFGDLWWKSPAGSESGWGVNVAHQGDILFATWFTYDSNGRGMWLVMSNGLKTGTNTYTGTLYRTTGPAFNATPWSPSKVAATAVGSATFTFSDATNGTFSATVNGVVQSKSITRQVYGSPTSVCRG